MCVRDDEGDEPAPSLTWTFPPTVRPITMSKLQRGHNPAESKVSVCTLTSFVSNDLIIRISQIKDKIK